MKLLCRFIASFVAMAIAAESTSTPSISFGGQVIGPAIYTTETDMEASWTAKTPVGGTLSTTTVYAFEQTASSYLTELVNSVADEKELHLLFTSVDAKDQVVESSDADVAAVKLRLSVLLSYSANQGIEDSAALFNELLDTIETKTKLLSLMQQAGAIDEDAASLEIVFSTADGENNTQEIENISHLSEQHNERSTASKGLVVAVTFLVVALISLSFIMIYTSGGFDDLFKQTPSMRRGVFTPPPIKQKKTDLESPDDDHDDFDDDVTTASGIIGAVPMYDTENMLALPGMSPRVRRENGADGDGTVSPLTNMTNASSMADGSRFPLGIRSIRKLAKYATPDKKNKKISGVLTYELSPN
mmetsp:Transcript_26361/g.37141  ORF Transcript_26361/g.37141 Transcript_26361/m.37141 type:complete len:359 (-) Transcript_26361:683-1759(-)